MTAISKPPVPESPTASAAALGVYKQRLVKRIPAAVSDGYRNILVNTIEAQVDAPTLDCGLQWAVQTAYHNGTESPSHEAIALFLCYGSGTIEGDAFRAQRGFYSQQPGHTHHIWDWSLRGLVNKHNTKVHVGEFDVSVIAADARQKKRPASAVEGKSPLPVDPTVYYASNNTPRLNSLVNSRHTGTKKSAAPRGPAVPQAILDRLPPLFHGPQHRRFRADQAAERQPLEDGACVNETQELVGRCLRHQEEAVAAVAEAHRLESERTEEAFRRLERCLDRIHAVVVGTTDALGGERAACVSFAAQQVDRMTTLKIRRGKRVRRQG
ncbi:hypothetical protein LY78DRAFT_665997 [Colletotrichum sublineola]|uniref:Uncharacterized protein n=1 Tax=Colletotrichum sublineola TaxID=1173701 RepID=A0A066X8L9_COLSU|nr:hypothetical protein LY78DRAFT_665997 [Colletotrichum sublineola]KDN65503.1 hypothetical protein CSUB01_01065 [Colletotrichum sublineola]